MSAVETIAVTYTLRGVERVHGCGKLAALAIVDLDVAGLVLTLQGVRIMQRPDGGLAVEAPTFRHPRTSMSLPCILLPPELSAAIAAEVLDAMGAPTLGRGGPAKRAA